MFETVVVGTDGSDTAGKAVERAVELCRQMGARLFIVSAFEAGSAGRALIDADAPEDAQWVISAREEVETLLGRAREFAEAHGIEAETFARRGDPADAILDVAEEQRADMIVVGNKGMTGAKRFLLGSVPNKVSHHAPCSVLIVRTS